jgi:uncharacterized protein YneF (UPF0154 family)
MYLKLGKIGVDQTRIEMMMERQSKKVSKKQSQQFAHSISRSAMK